MVEICEVRNEYPDASYPVVMEDCVDNNSGETQRNMFEQNIKTNLDATKMVIETFLDVHDDDKKKKSEKKIGEIHTVTFEKIKEIHWDVLDKEKNESSNDTIPADGEICKY